MTTALVTGASGGIGAELAVSLARRGFDIGLVARRADALAAVAERVEATGRRAVIVPTDVTDRDAVHRAVATVEGALGPIDLAIANAGSGAPTPARRLDAPVVTGLFRLNVDGAVHLFEAVLPGMLARGNGHLAAVSSIAAWRGLPINGAYSATKAALDVLLEAWAVELRGTGVAVTTVHPGFVRTPLTDKNPFPMPFLLEADDAAERIAAGLVARRRSIDFPWPMVMLMRAVHQLPNGLWERVATRLLPRGRTSGAP